MTYQPSAEHFLRISYGNIDVAILSAHASLAKMNMWPDCDEKYRRIYLTHCALLDMKDTQCRTSPQNGHTA